MAELSLLFWNVAGKDLRRRVAQLARSADVVVLAENVAPPDALVAARVGTIPMQVVVGIIDFLFGRRQDVTIDERVELPVGQVVGEIEDHALLIESLDHTRQPVGQLRITKLDP